MPVGDVPTFIGSAYATSTVNPLTNFGIQPIQNSLVGSLERRVNAINWPFDKEVPQKQPTYGEVAMAEPSRRIVKVFIVDPNAQVPISDCMIYSSEEKLTDLTDQELFFELDMKGLLEQHNAKRVKIVNKTVKDRTEYLEPIKIRELKMLVTTVASF